MAIENTYLTGNAIQLGSSGFDLAAPAPLDTRTTVPVYAGLAALKNGGAVYEGMRVYVEASDDNGEKGNYQYINGEWKNELAELKTLIENTATAAMEFKGAAASLPANPAKGDMYKVTASFKVGEEDVKIGDSIVYDGSQWFVIPSGDDIEDTWRPVTGVDNDSTLTFAAGDKLEKTVAADGTITYKHVVVDAPELLAENEQTRTYITEVETDGFGHITGYKTATENVVDTNTTYEFEGLPVGEDETAPSSVYFQVKADDAEAAEVIYLDAYNKNEVDAELAKKASVEITNDHEDRLVAFEKTITWESDPEAIDTPPISYYDGGIYISNLYVGDSMEHAEVATKDEVYTKDEVDTAIDERVSPFEKVFNVEDGGVGVDDLNAVYSLSVNNGKIVLSVDEDGDNPSITVDGREVALQATTLAGYGITNAYTKDDVDTAIDNLVANLTGQGDADIVVAEAGAANQDGSGNVITATYETKSDASAKLTEAKEYTDDEIERALNRLGDGDLQVASALTALDATRAVCDGTGNAIHTTYETKLDASAKLTEAKNYADGKDAAIQAAQKAADDITGYVGTFTHATAKTVVEYINAKTDGIATSGNLEALGTRVTTAEGKITDLETASATHALKSEVEAVDAKFANYNTATAQKAIDDEQDRRLGVIEGDYVKSADIANFETKANVQKVADDLAAYVESNDAALAAETKARTDADAGFETRIAALEGNFGDGEGTVEAQIAAAVKAEADIARAAEKANADAIDVVEGRMDTAEGKITTLETESAKHAVKTEVEGALALKADKSVVDAMYTNAQIDGFIAEAKKYADDNDADTKYGIVYDSDNKKIKLVEGGTVAEIDATAFIKDGMIESVALSDDGLNLVITWNTDSNKGENNVTTIPLSGLVDIYTGVEGARVNVAVSSDKKVSADIVVGSIGKDYLDTGVKASLALADSAIQTHQDISHLATTEALNGVDAKFSNYTNTTDMNAKFDLKADKTQVATDIANAIAPLATTEALNDVKEIAEAARTESEVDGQIDAKIGALNLATTYEPIGAETRAIAAAKTETENQVKALADGQVTTNKNDIADLFAQMQWGEF